jgi:hydroxymethylglutaryl-CoA lyase
MIQLVECPRDAMQGWPSIIPTKLKIEYINSLLEVGFHTIDFGSFVSAKAIPQMSDTAEVLKGLHNAGSASKLLAIVANVRGAEEACRYEAISYLGFPFSVSPTFQQRNTNSIPEESLDRVSQIRELCQKHGKELVVYLSMGFGNPYGDPYNETVLMDGAASMVQRDIRIISLADTVGLARPEQVSFALNTLLPRYPDTLFGVHLHSTHDTLISKLEAALDAGCTRFDGALKGIGGCPMAGNDLIGNMNTENIIAYLEERNLVKNINKVALRNSLKLASEIFN